VRNGGTRFSVRAMNRRSVLALGLAAGASCTAQLAGCARATSGRLSSPTTAAQPGPHPELEEATIAELADKLQRRELTSVDLVDRYLARIGALDRSGPTLRSVLELDPDARSIAAKLDDERRTRGPRSPLHGIPMLVKDNVDTVGRTRTTAGSLALVGAQPAQDAEIVARLRRAGAVLLGKTNLSEWANIRSLRSTSGWSATGGLTRNPYALDRNPSGSSSGSAVAIAANLAAFAIGTETDGSIVSPSSISGIVGFKPTVGLVSRSGIIPISHSQDTAGPMTRSVADAAIILGVLAGADPRDGATTVLAGRSMPDYVASLRTDGARGKRIGVVRSFKFIPRSAVAVFDAAVEELRRLDAIVIDPVDIGPVGKLDEPDLELMLYELKADMAAYLATRPGIPFKTLEDLVRFNREHAAEELRYFGQDLFEQASKKGGLDSPGYLEVAAICRRLSRDEGIDPALRNHRLDALVAPTGGPAWLTDLINGDGVSGSSSSPAAIAGYPAITVPAGSVHGLPVGISFFGAAFSEPVLLALAYAYEQRTRHRFKPRYLPTVEGL
jgi:amidase